MNEKTLFNRVGLRFVNRTLNEFVFWKMRFKLYIEHIHTPNTHIHT